MDYKAFIEWLRWSKFVTPAVIERITPANYKAHPLYQRFLETSQPIKQIKPPDFSITAPYEPPPANFYTSRAERRATRKGQAPNFPQYITMPDGTQIPVLTWRLVDKEGGAWATVEKLGGKEQVIEEGSQIYVPIVPAQYLTFAVLDRIEEAYVFGIDDTGAIGNEGKPLDTAKQLEDFSGLDSIPRSSIYYTYLQPQGITQEEANKGLTAQWMDYFAGLQSQGKLRDYFKDSPDIEKDIQKKLFSTTKYGQELGAWEENQQRIQQQQKLESDTMVAQGFAEQTNANVAEQERLKQLKESTPEFYPKGRILTAEEAKTGIGTNDIVIATSEEEAARLGATQWIPAQDWFGQGRHKLADEESARITAMFNQGGQTPIQAGMSADQAGRWKALQVEGQIPDITHQGADESSGFEPMVKTPPLYNQPQMTSVGVERQAGDVAEQQRKWQQLVAKAQEAEQKRRLATATPERVVRF